jgi:glycosyltransferase involved in cell wall biosynthesis
VRYMFFAAGSYVGGLEIVTLELMQTLASMNHIPLAVISGWNDGHYAKLLERAGIRHSAVKIGRLYRRKPLWTLDGLAHFPAAAVQLNRIIRDFAPDFVIHSSLQLAMSTLPIMPRSLSPMFYAHNAPDETYTGIVGRLVLPRMAGILCVSNFVNTEIQTLVGNSIKIRTVHNGISESPALSWTPSKKIRLAVVGQFLRSKNHLVVIEALHDILSRSPIDIEVLFFGNDRTAYADEVRARITELRLGDFVDFKGFVSRREDIYRSVDIVIAPAIDDAFGMTIIEAGMFGRPCIAARSGGHPEIIVNGQTGVLFEPSNPRDLANAIEMLLDRDRRQALVLAARDHILSNYTAQVMANRFVDSLTELTAAD